MCFKVLVTNGELDIDYEYLLNAIVISETEAVVYLKEGFEVRPSWTQITEEQFKSYFPSPDPEEGLPSRDEVLGEFMVHQMLKNAEIEQKLDTIGETMVQLLLK